jgi:hypothetical protein
MRLKEIPWGGGEEHGRNARIRGQRNGASGFEAGRNVAVQGEVFGCMTGISWRPISASLRFTDGAVIGSKAFVNEAFTNSRERFGASRQDGARRMRGGCKPAAGWLWSLRDLRIRV